MSLPVSKALQCHTYPYGKGKPLVCCRCEQVRWVCEQLLFAFPVLPEQKEQIQKPELALSGGRRCASVTRPLTLRAEIHLT